jgi:glycyl-tRNA synthetase beta chain
MAELLLELYSEEIPPQLQIAARSQIKQYIENSFKEENLKYKELSVYSSPTRLTIFTKDLTENIKIEAKEIKGPKVGSPNQVLQGFLRAKNVNEKDLIEKNTDKGKFYFVKTQSQLILVKDLLIKIIPKAIGSINWKKSMKWSDHNLMWGRPLRSIFAKFNNKKLTFKFEHLDTTDEVIIEQDLIIKTKKIKDFRDYLNFLKTNKIIVDRGGYS